MAYAQSCPAAVAGCGHAVIPSGKTLGTFVPRGGHGCIYAVLTPSVAVLFGFGTPLFQERHVCPSATSLRLTRHRINQLSVTLLLIIERDGLT